MKQFISDYLSSNYLTVMVLLAFTTLLLIDRSITNKPIKLLAASMLLTLMVSFLGQLEIWCDLYDKPVWILYIKSALVYMIYPMILLFELFVTLPNKNKLMMAIPQILNTVLLVCNACGLEIIYGYRADHSFIAGPLRMYPAVLMCFYVGALSVTAARMMHGGERKQGAVLLFISFASILTLLLELAEIAMGYTDEICALGLLVYYWVISANSHDQIREQLHRTQLEAERSKNELLVAQIRPHFINNSLMAIRSRARDYPELYESITRFSKYLRSHFDAMGDAKMIPFEKEMDNVEAYLDLERENYGDLLDVQYDIEDDAFLIPALTVQPLVENAVRHGIGDYARGGTVWIRAHRQEGRIVIEVADDGSGATCAETEKTARKGIGIENVRKRLRSISNGELEILHGDHGTTARIILDDTTEGGK